MGEKWQTQDMQRWSSDDITNLLDEAQASLLDVAERLCVKVQLIRKDRAVGIVPTSPTLYETLEEMALTVQYALQGSATKLPFCAFNGGNDVFCDIGDKAIGIQALQSYLNYQPSQTLHV